MEQCTESAGIYAITNMENGKAYIGSTIDFERRWGEHRGALLQGEHSNLYLQHSWNKYGEKAFEFGVLEYLGNLEELHLAEQFWMEVYRRESKELYNIGKYAYNGRRGVPCSEEHKKKIGDANRGRKLPPVSDESRRKNSESNKGRLAWNRGKKLSKEHRRRMSEAHMGHPVSKETRRKMSISAKARWARIREGVSCDIARL